MKYQNAPISKRFIRQFHITISCCVVIRHKRMIEFSTPYQSLKHSPFTNNCFSFVFL